MFFSFLVNGLIGIHIPLIKKLFASKRQMRSELSAKEVVYNAFSLFARDMKMPFKKARQLWVYLDQENRNLFASLANAVTSLGRQAKKDMRKRVNNYPLTGPLGSQDPILPVCIDKLYDAMNDPKNNMPQKWKKESIYKWSLRFDKVRKPYSPSRRASF